MRNDRAAFCAKTNLTGVLNGIDGDPWTRHGA